MAPAKIRLLALVLGCTFFGNAAPGFAGDKSSFIIPPRDGYGISECLAGSDDCGRVVADSWCEAHGLAKASSFGILDDVTAAIPAAGGLAAKPASRTEPGSYVINCEP